MQAKVQRESGYRANNLEEQGLDKRLSMEALMREQNLMADCYLKNL